MRGVWDASRKLANTKMGPKRRRWSAARMCNVTIEEWAEAQGKDRKYGGCGSITLMTLAEGEEMKFADAIDAPSDEGDDGEEEEPLKFGLQETHKGLKGMKCARATTTGTAPKEVWQEVTKHNEGIGRVRYSGKVMVDALNWYGKKRSVPERWQTREASKLDKNNGEK